MLLSVMCPKDAGRAIAERRAVQPILPRACCLQGSVPRPHPKHRHTNRQTARLCPFIFQAAKREQSTPSCPHQHSSELCTGECMKIIFIRGYFMFQHHISLDHLQPFTVGLCLGFVCFIFLPASALKKHNSFALLKASSWV